MPNQYMVLLRPGGAPASGEAASLTLQYGGQVKRVWEHAARGYLLSTTENAARGLSHNPRVEGVYQDTFLPADVYLANDTPFCYAAPTRVDCDPSGNWTFNNRTFAGLPQAIVCANPDPAATGCIDNWGLDRLDGFSTARDGAYAPPGDGTGVHVYLIDTGVRASNQEFAGRVIGGFNGTFDENELCADCWPFCFPPCGTDTTDYHGHGTHVAGILGGLFAGVAKNVQIHPVRWYDRTCRAQQSALVTDLDWILVNHNASEPTAIVSLSAAGPEWSTNVLFTMLQTSMFNLASRDNIVLVQGAGNGSEDACDWTFGDESRFEPSSAAYRAASKAIIVGGSDESDGRWTCLSGIDEHCQSLNSGSNVGKCLDLFAPAPHIVSAWHGVGNPGDEKAVCRLAGTSMAAPHVSGIAALILQAEPGLDASGVKARILAWARRDILNAVPGDPNYIGAESPNLLASVLGFLLFRDGFESGTTAAWTDTVP